MRALPASFALMLACAPGLAHAGTDEVDLLVFTRTAGFRHDSIPLGIAAVQQIADGRGWAVVASEDPAMFEPTTLAEFEVVVFLNTTGDVLDDVQQAALEGWVQAGGGFVGIHSATDTEQSWPWYVGLVGTTFADHPAPQLATLHVEDPAHPATQVVPDPWIRTDEWYNFQSNPSAAVDVLLWLDETTYTGGTMGREHPIAWSHHYDGGRSFYTALGHTNAAWGEPEFLAHVAGGLEWAATTPPDGGGSSSGGGESDDGTDASDDTGATTSAADTGSPTPSSTGRPEPGGSSTTTASDAGSTSAESSANDMADPAGCGCTARSGEGGRWTALAWLVLVACRRTPRSRTQTRIVT